MAKAIEAGIPKLRIEEAAARTQARIDSGQQVIVGVNRYKPDGDRAIDLLRVDNGNVRTLQIDKLKRLRAERDGQAVEARLAALTEAAQGSGNLLALAVEAAREKATVGEISEALERAWGRHRAEIRAISGSTSGRWAACRRRSSGCAGRSRPSRRPTGAVPASSSPRWARTGTIAARR